MNLEFLSKLNGGALLTATKQDGTSNTMAVSWGGCGILWGKRVAFVFVRPERHTFTFTEGECKLTLSFFDEGKRDTLAYCGTKSGRDVDKFKECGLKYTLKDGYLIFDDAIFTMTLDKMYADNIKKECFIDTDSLKWYQSSGYHKMYICEIKETMGI